MPRISCRRFDPPILGSLLVSLNTNEMLQAPNAALSRTRFVLFLTTGPVLQSDILCRISSSPLSIKNRLTSLEAKIVRNYDSPTYHTDSPTWVKCRATSVAKNLFSKYFSYHLETASIHAASKYAFDKLNILHPLPSTGVSRGRLTNDYKI